MIELIALDPSTATLIETLVVTGFMVCASACALMLLPWTDAEIDEVDGAFRSALQATAIQSLRHPATRTIS